MTRIEQGIAEMYDALSSNREFMTDDEYSQQKEEADAIAKRMRMTEAVDQLVDRLGSYKLQDQDQFIKQLVDTMNVNGMNYAIQFLGQTCKDKVGPVSSFGFVLAETKIVDPDE